MRAVVQRVMKASVSGSVAVRLVCTVGDDLVSSIGQGLCVLIGISRDDSRQDVDFMVRKILNLRVFDDENGKRWAKSVMDKELEVLCVSQFTLYAVMKGNKPDYHLSMGGEESQAFYQDFIKHMERAYVPERIKDGVFGAEMQVNIQNDGPVTITLESPIKEVKKGNGPKVKGKKESQSNTTSGASESCTSPEDTTVDPQ